MAERFCADCVVGMMFLSARGAQLHRICDVTAAAARSTNEMHANCELQIAGNPSNIKEVRFGISNFAGKIGTRV